MPMRRGVPETPYAASSGLLHAGGDCETLFENLLEALGNYECVATITAQGACTV